MISYVVRVDTGSHSLHVRGEVNGVPLSASLQWGQQPHQYMAARGRPDSIVATPGGFSFEYVVVPRQTTSDDSPVMVLDSAHFRSWGAPLFAIPVTETSWDRITVQFLLPRGWQLASTFGGDRLSFEVPTVQDLHSGAFLAGALEEKEINAGGVPARVVSRREVPTSKPELSAAVGAVLTAMSARIGPLPVSRVFFGADSRGAQRSNAPGNAESTSRHLSALFTYGSSLPATPERVGAMAHELSHMWIPGSLGDLVASGSYDHLGPFVIEGFTNYLGYRLAYDAGLLTEAQFAGQLSHYLIEYSLLLSPAGSQWRAGLPYSHGLLAALVLDVELRKRSGGARTFYDVVSLLRQRGSTTAGVTGLTLHDILVELGGAGLDSTFRTMQRSDVPLPLASLVAGSGITIRPIADVVRADREERAGRRPDVIVFTREPESARALENFLDNRPDSHHPRELRSQVLTAPMRQK